ncbi:hypothetical protein UY3_00732 [Chelonia mydas]|uniref:KAP NTPase domain-containing protein n=1 Tax=Chelonia mydas TaxID=8469 RepID=M7BVZ2_CHEMY|nr:hypothetical protein UY3_00732 [Chelonia mydas]
MASLMTQSLVTYVEEENVPALKALLEKCKDVDERNENGQTPLMLAAEQGNLEIVKELLKKGANCNLEDTDNWTALISAAKEGYVDIVAELFNCNVNLEHRDMGGWTALMWASYKGCTKVAELLLEKGANPNITGQYGTTPLIWAARKGHLECVKYLLQMGADVDQEGANSMTALIVAVKGGYTDSVKEILKRNPNVNLTDKDGNTALMIASKEGHTEIVQDLLDAGTYVNIPDRSGDTVLIGAVRGGHVEIVRALLHKYADIDIRGQKGDTPLHIAIRGRSRKLAELLLRNPKDGRLLYRPNKAGETPYNIDCSHQKSILTQIFGARHLSPTETDGDMLGYDLYSSALADILSEPTMQPPICVGLYAQWGSGKSFLLKKLEGKKKWKKTCCLPSFVIFLFILGCVIAGITLLVIFNVDPKNMTVNAILISVACVVGLAFILNCRTWWQVLDSVLNSQRKRLHNAASKLHKLKSEGFMKVLKCEVELMAKMAKTIDSFTQNQTRLVVIIDGLDACEQDKVLQMLDTVRVLFSKGPFIAIFASDPHIIIKAINQNLNSVLRDSNINGHDYMRNIVHLPVFLNSRGLSSAKKLMVASTTNGDIPYTDTSGIHEEVDRRVSQNSLGEMTKLGSKTALNRRDTYRRRQMQRTITRQMSFDLTKLLVTEDWFSDISPQTMRRLLNIVSVTGRLLRANQITFNWDRLASWINLTEQWPYRTSWLILYLEETEGVPDQLTLKTIYERLCWRRPSSNTHVPPDRQGGQETGFYGSKGFRFWISNSLALMAKYDFVNCGQMAEFADKLPQLDRSQFQAVLQKGKLRKSICQAAVDSADVSSRHLEWL